MDNLAELLKTIDRSKLDEALALLQSLRNDQPPQTTESSSAQPAFSSSSATAQPPSTDSARVVEAEGPHPDQVSKASSGDLRSSPLDDDDVPLASLGHVLTPEEKKNVREAYRAEKDAEREARKRAKEEELQFAKLEADSRKAIGDEEREVRRVLRDSEREARKAVREAEKEARRKELEAEKEQRQRAREAEQEARQKAREAEKEALKVPKEAVNSLAVFGFLSSTVKADSKKNKLFSTFVQDKRVVPAALQLWAKPEGSAPLNEEDASVVNIPASEFHKCAPRDGEHSRSRFVDEESSLLHPPICVEQDVAPKSEVCVRDFNAMIEASNTQQTQPRVLLRECGCTFHVAVADPYPSFDNEVVFSGFFAMGYDPCQSRPPYFGTFNHLQEGNLNEVELLQMARFPPGGGIPRLSNIDYDYDSGDDWDVMEGDEDIAASTSADSDDNSDMNSLDSSDLEFINDDDDEDSDCDIQRRVMEARQRRLFRLRNKDKLVPSYSGPFVGIPTDEHPLRNFDEMERMAPMTSAYFSSLLENELNALVGGNAGIPAIGDEDLSAEELDAKRQRALMEAALKNRREMTDEELKALHDMVKANAKISPRMIIRAFKEQQLCVGVAQAEMVRTIKRFYERRHNSLVLRDVPWSPTDERLFASTTTSSNKKPKSTDNEDGAKPGDEDEDGEDDGESAEVANDPAPAAPAMPPVTVVKVEEVGHSAAPSRSSAEVKEESAPRVKQMTLTELMPKVSAVREAKRQREDEHPEDQDGGVRTTTID